MGSWSNSFSVLLRRVRRELTHALPLYPCSGKDKVDISRPGREPSPEPSYADYLDLRLPAPRTMRNGQFCCLSHPVCGTLLWRPKLTGWKKTETTQWIWGKFHACASIISCSRPKAPWYPVSHVIPHCNWRPTGPAKGFPTEVFYGGVSATTQS